MSASLAAAAGAIAIEPDPRIPAGGVDGLPPGVERDRRRATDQFRTIFNSVSDGILIFETSGRLLEVNRVVCERLGYERDELLKMNVTELDTPESAALFLERMQLVLRQGHATYEVDHRRRDGTVLALEVASTAIEFDGAPAILSVQRDITERRRAEAEAAAQRRYTEELLDAIPAPIIAKDLDGRVAQCNIAFLEVSNKDRSGVIGKTIAEMGLHSTALFEALDREVIESGTVKHQEVWMPLPGGAGRLLLTRAPMKAADGTVRGTITSAIDITERYVAEQELRQSEERFRTLFESASDAIFIVDLTGRFLSVNRAAADSLGYTQAELRGMTVADISGGGSASMAEQIATVLKRGHLAFETSHVRRDGTRIPVELSVTSLDLEGHRVVLGIARDVSERKRAETERELLESQLRQAQKMEGIGRLASGIAHDFNNLLQAIGGFAELAMVGLPAEEERRRDIEQIKEAADRATTLVRQLLAFSRASKVEPKVIAPGAVVARLERLLKPMIREDIDLNVDVSDGHSQVLADAGQIEQVVVNFAVNAVDAMRRGGHLNIRVADVEVDDELAMKTGGKTGPNVLLEVSDDGTGMTDETMQHLFEPFFTTKGPGEGTGLGLATVYGIVRNWGGGLGVRSELGSGSTFSVYLPCVKESIEGAAAAESQTHVPGVGLGRRILVVEDDDVVRRYAVRVLEKAGYDVIAPETAPQAVELGRDAEISLLLTDVVMPSMLGADVAGALQAVHPDLPVVFMSGYTDTAPERGHQAYLAKPFSAETLLRIIEESLGNGGTRG